MPLLLVPDNFTSERFNDTLIAIIQAFIAGDPILSKNAVPPDFHSFAKSKGYVMEVKREVVGDSPFADCVVTPSCENTWGIEGGDVVRHKDRILNHGVQMNVLRDFEGLAEVDYFDNKGVNRQSWVLNADLDLIHKHKGGFRNAGEAS